MTKRPNPRTDLAKVARASVGGVVTVARASEALGLGNRSGALRLAAMARKGWLIRLRRGIYLILPIEVASPARAVVEDPWVLAHVLYSPCYIGGWSAAEHWSLTEQIFRPTFVVTSANIRKRTEVVLDTEFRLVRVGRSALEGATTIWRGSAQVQVSDRERTIVDGANSPEWVGGVRHLADMLVTYRESDEHNVERLSATLAAHGRGAGHKRLGYLAQVLWPEAIQLLKGAQAGRSAGVIKLDPSLRSKGRLDKRWGLWINVLAALGSP